MRASMQGLPLLTTFLLLSEVGVLAQDDRPRAGPSDILIRLRPDPAAGSEEDWLRDHGLAVRYRFDGLEAWLVRSPEDVEQSCSSLRADPQVEFAHPDSEGCWCPDSPVCPRCPMLHNTGQVVEGVAGIADADIDAPEAWAIRHDATPVIIAIADSGCQLNHPDLAPNLWANPQDWPNGFDDDGNGKVDDWRGWSFDTNTTNVNDTFGHGTRVPGILGARGSNAFGIQGVCWEARMMVLKIGNAAPAASAAAAAIEYAALHGAAVLNLSAAFPSSTAPILQSALNFAATRGMVVVVPAGNAGENLDGGTLNVPAELSGQHLLVVAATDNRDLLYGFSNWGATAVDLAAPGGSMTTVTGNGYAYVAGTSYAAACVTGAVALVRAESPSMTAADVVSRIKATADPKSALSGRVASGARLNLFNALASVASGGMELGVLHPFSGTLSLAVTRAPALAEIYVLISGTPANPMGSGPVFGLSQDADYAFGQPLGAAPHHMLTDSRGAYAWTGPALPPGVTSDFRAVAPQPSGPLPSNIVRISG